MVGLDMVTGFDRDRVNGCRTHLCAGKLENSRCGSFRA